MVFSKWALTTTALATIAGAAVAGCGDSVTISNTSPKGSVGGVVIDAASRTPLADASVTLIAGGQIFAPELTAADGSFRFQDVPAGTLLLQVTSPDTIHWNASIAALLTGAAGMFPTGNEALTLSIGLVPASSPFKFRVLSEDGQPVVGYDVGAETTFEWVDYSSGAPDAEGTRHFAGVTDADGYITLPGMPDYWRLGTAVNDALILTLPPRDADGDGVLEFAGGVRTFFMRSLADPTPDVILDPSYETTLYVVASTLGVLEPGGTGSTAEPALIGSGDSIFIKFNLPIEDGSVEVNLANEQGVPIMPAATTKVTDDLLELSFNSMTAGAEYNLWVHVVTSVGDRLVQGDFSAPFFVYNPAPTVTVTSMTRSPSDLVRVTFSEPIGTGNPGWNYLDGGNCVLFFAADLNGSGLPIGDVPGELGHANCEGGRTFYAVETDPTGPVGLSGYTSTWEFYVPSTPMGVLPAGTPLHILFSHVTNAAFLMERTDGRPVSDLAGGAAVTLP